MKKEIIKQHIYHFYSCVLHLVEILFPLQMFSKKIDWSKDKCLGILKSAGYDFRPLWRKLPDLPPNSIDLSIIIPVYNSEHFLEKCLLTLLNQDTKFCYEVICVNDGSTDGSLKILERFALQYPNILRFISQENQGIGCARNNGLSLARGQFVGFVDVDDTVSTEYVETLLSRVKKTNADMIQVAYDNIDIKGNILSMVSKGNHVLNEKGTYLEKEKLVRGYPWGGAYKKELFDKIGFPEGYWFEDMMIRVLLMRRAKTIETVRDVLYHYLVHPTNTTKLQHHSSNIRSVDQYWLLSQLLNYQIETLGLPIDDAQYIVILKETSYLLWARTKGLPQTCRKAVFCLAADMVSFLNYSIPLLPYELDRVEGFLKNRNFLGWNILSQRLWVELRSGKAIR